MEKDSIENIFKAYFPKEGTTLTQAILTLTQKLGLPCNVEDIQDDPNFLDNIHTRFPIETTTPSQLTVLSVALAIRTPHVLPDTEHPDFPLVEHLRRIWTNLKKSHRPPNIVSCAQIDFYKWFIQRPKSNSLAKAS